MARNSDIPEYMCDSCHGLVDYFYRTDVSYFPPHDSTLTGSTSIPCLDDWVRLDPLDPDSKVFVPDGQRKEDKPEGLEYRKAKSRHWWTPNEWGWTEEADKKAREEKAAADAAGQAYHWPGSRWKPSEYGYKPRVAMNGKTYPSKKGKKNAKSGKYRNRRGRRGYRKKTSYYLFRKCWERFKIYRAHARYLMVKQETFYLHTTMWPLYSKLRRSVEELETLRNAIIQGVLSEHGGKTQLEISNMINGYKINMNEESPLIENETRLHQLYYYGAALKQDFESFNYETEFDVTALPGLESSDTVYLTVLIAFYRALQAIMYRMVVKRLVTEHVTMQGERGKDRDTFLQYYDAANANLAFCLNHAKSRGIRFNRPDKADLDIVGEMSSRDMASQYMQRGMKVPMYLAKYAPVGAVIQTIEEVDARPPVLKDPVRERELEERQAKNRAEKERAAGENRPTSPTYPPPDVREAGDESESTDDEESQEENQASGRGEEASEALKGKRGREGSNEPESPRDGRRRNASASSSDTEGSDSEDKESESSEEEGSSEENQEASEEPPSAREEERESPGEEESTEPRNLGQHRVKPPSELTRTGKRRVEQVQRQVKRRNDRRSPDRRSPDRRSPDRGSPVRPARPAGEAWGGKRRDRSSSNSRSSRESRRQRTDSIFVNSLPSLLDDSDESS